jgi:AP endonuclease-2
LGVLCPPGSSTPYRELPEDACIGGYPSALQVTELDGADPTALDAEGRCLVLEFPAFVLFGVYSPANSNGLRDGFRSGFLKALDTRIRNLKKMGKHVILTGDLNVSREPIDTARAEENMREEGITLDEYQNTTNRRVFNQLVNNGRVPGERDEGREEPVLWDICREFHPERTGMFTHWEQKINARPGNFGSRIDYVLCSIAMKDWFADSNIQEGLMGSDHCPVFAVTKDMVEWKGKQVHISDIMNPPGTFEDGKRLREFDPTKDLLPISAKRLPEFDISKRRSIKDMFSRKSSVPKALSTPVGLPGFSNASPKPENPDVTQVVVKVGDPGPGSAPTKSSTATGPTKTPEKRPASSGPIKSAKRTKTNTGATNSQFSGKGQQSLRGFFTSKTPTTKSMSSQEAESSQEPTNTQETETSLDLPFSTLSPLAESSEPFIDPEASKESWTKLFSKKPPPRCEGHQEPCISLTTKKPGQNCGRSFWICPR